MDTSTGSADGHDCSGTREMDRWWRRCGGGEFRSASPTLANASRHTSGCGPCSTASIPRNSSPCAVTRSLAVASIRDCLRYGSWLYVGVLADYQGIDLVLESLGPVLLTIQAFSSFRRVSRGSLPTTGRRARTRGSRLFPGKVPFDGHTDTDGLADVGITAKALGHRGQSEDLQLPRVRPAGRGVRQSRQPGDPR